MYSVTLIALVISIKYYHRHRELRVFTYYILLSLLEDSTSVYETIMGPDIFFPHVIHGVIANMFMLTEFSVFVYFILQHISTVKRRRAIQIDAVLFFLLVLWTMLRDHRFIIIAGLFPVESFFLVLPPLLYFFELFIRAPSNALKDQPAFWIITGILFLNCCSIPLQFAKAYMGRHAIEWYNLNYLLYALFFFLLIKAYLCKPEPQWESAAG